MSSFENLTWFWENYKIRRSPALHFLHCMLYVFSLLIYVLDGDDYCVKVIEIDSLHYRDGDLHAIAQPR
jgi:hypothetical protein